MDAAILSFEGAEPDPVRVGGKGANLVRLAQAGFTVPPGFCVTTAAYRAVLSTGLDAEIARILDEIDYADADGLEERTAEIRAAVNAAEIPEELRAEIESAYTELGDQPFVAVRSSGTAEDLSEASFAGLHDTFLDVRGANELVDAIRSCWASLWTARATAYRESKGYDHAEVSLAVVVQVMVESDVSGVMFTGNPMNAGTDEIVVNASWGLGEAIVSGIVTPDEYVLRSGTLKVIERTTGAKEKRIDRAPDGGTVTTDVGRAEGERLSLDDRQVAELARIGLRVQEHYGGFPQDIEWALQGGRFHLLQSRPITGVDFSWDADVDAWWGTPEDDDVTWTRQTADEVWNGAITPLFYSWRAYLWQRANHALAQAMALEGASRMWVWKFHRSETYFNTKLQRRIVEEACPPLFRPPMLGWLPPDEREAAERAPFSYARYLWRYLAHQLRHPRRGLLAWQRHFDQLVEQTVAGGRRHLEADLSGLTDEQLVRRVDEMIEYEGSYYREIWVPFWIYGRDISSIMAGIVITGYDGDGELAVVELMTGVPKRTVTMEENYRLWQLAERIRASSALRDAFEQHEGADFLAELENGDEGREYLQAHRAFLHDFGHRGHADRDMYYPRRSEDPSIAHRSVKTMLSVAESQDPELREREVNARREQVAADVIASLRRKPLGALRVRAFRFTLEYVLKFLMARDDERTMADMTTLAIKRGYEEISRRLLERGLLEGERDHYFLARHELYDLFLGRTDQLDLVRAKIAARARNFDAFLNREANLAPYLRRGRGVDLEAAAAAGEDGVLSGVGTSRGTVTGTARVVHGLDEIGRVKEGEILICHATDPGWTPVFIVISGLVLETGGVLAHGSCLSREYGLPCVQVAGATGLIPDGATIMVNGDDGTVVIAEEPAPAQAEPEPVGT